MSTPDLHSPATELVAGEWITFDQVKLALGIPTHDTVDDAWLQLCVDGVNQIITDTRPRDSTGALPPTNGRIVWGGVQLATRWYSRRNSSDVSAFVELGGPPPSIDRDIEVALEINRYFGPVAL